MLYFYNTFNGKSQNGFTLCSSVLVAGFAIEFEKSLVGKIAPLFQHWSPSKISSLFGLQTYCLHSLTILSGGHFFAQIACNADQWKVEIEWTMLRFKVSG